MILPWVTGGQADKVKDNEVVGGVGGGSTLKP